MARFNLFEGSRRIALLLKVLWAIGALAVGWTSAPFVSMEFATSHPDAGFIASDNCKIGTDAVEFINREIEDGQTVSVELCFKALQADSGAQIVPYKVEKGRWWGNSPYTPDVMAYTDARSESFKLSEDARRTARDEWSVQRSRNIRNGVLFAVGGWVVLSLFQMLVGWIVRGFLGIPWRQDRRPESATRGATVSRGE
jgi:hypothetical protein